ncbi:MAG: hypothetical protein KDH96_09500, partial [Candidatus Riesia sp.]|nr:hypothetical protein [Candidatus Riesia sp.]
MIKEDKILIKVTSRNKNIFIDKGYDVKYGEECEIKVSDLSNGSHYKITAICDVCGDENRIMYTKYIDNHNRYGFYGCKKCSNVKRERTSIIKWGVSNYRKTKECDSKIKSYNLEKYGVEHTFQIEDVKNRIKETNLKKYG